MIFFENQLTTFRAVYAVEVNLGQLVLASASFKKNPRKYSTVRFDYFQQPHCIVFKVRTKRQK